MSAEQPWPPHVQSLISNTRDVQTLLGIHLAIAGGRPGRPPDLEVLHKGAVTLLVACWEAYVEDLAEAAFSTLMTKAETPDIFPTKVLVLASKALTDDADERKVWSLAGDGWRTVMQSHKKALLERHIGRLNTPRQANIDALFEGLLALRSLSKSWKWRGISNATAIRRLDDLITLRGEISHRVRASKTVRKSYVIRSIHLINRLAATSSNAVRTHIHGVLGIYPWISVTYGETA